MPRRLRVKEAFNSYRAEVVPANAGAAQVRETKRAFYSGALIMFQAILASLEPGEDATEGDVKVLEDLDIELKTFLIDVKGGRE